MNKTKRIHTFYVYNENNFGNANYEKYGNHDDAKKMVLDYLDTKQDDEIVGILWTYQDYIYSESLSKMKGEKIYEGTGNIVNVISRCADDNRVTVAEAKNLIKSTGVSGEKFAHIPEEIETEEVDTIEDLLDE